MMKVLGSSVFFFFASAMAMTAHADSWFEKNSDLYPVQTAPKSVKKTSELKRKTMTPFDAGSNNLALEVGQVFLMGNASKYSDSLGTRVNYTYGVSELFAYEAALSYSNHSDGQFSQLALSSGLRMNFMNYDQVIPYAGAGLGFYRPNQQITPALSQSSTLFGIYLGAGLDLKLTNQIFFGPNLKFQHAFGKTTESPIGPVSLGGTSIDFMGRVGYTF